MEIEETIQPLTNEQRTQWNGFLTNLNGQPVTEDAMNAHAEVNPDFSIKPEMLPQIQQEHAAIRTGNNFGNLNLDQLNAARSGMSENFTGQTNLSKSFYPQFKVGSKDFGTDIEGYTSFKAGLAPINEGETIDPAKAAGPAPATVPAPIKVAPVPAPSEEANIIPKPDYNDQASRNIYLKNWAAKYGDLKGRGDTVLKVNEVPRAGSDTIRNISVKAASKYGIDPALLYSSAMEEGASALFKNKSGLDTKGRKPTDFGYQSFYGDKEFPVNGNESMGMPDFANRFPELVEKGYLPKDFANKFRGKKNAGAFSENDFKTVEDGMQAKAALLKYNYDYVDKYAAKKGIQLSEKAKDFFALAAFNGGEGAVIKRMQKYKDAGLLEGDKFLKQRPEMEKNLPDNLDVYGHIVPRMKMRDALKEQKHFD